MWGGGLSREGPVGSCSVHRLYEAGTRQSQGLITLVLPFCRFSEWWVDFASRNICGGPSIWDRYVFCLLGQVGGAFSEIHLGLCGLFLGV